MNDAAAVVEEVEEVEPIEADAEVEEVSEDSENEKPEKQEAEAEDSSPEKKDGTQKRINELTKLRREAEREREYWKELASQKTPEPTKFEPGKSLSDFDYDESKFADYLRQEAREEARKTVQGEYQREQTIKKQVNFRNAEADYSKTVPDYMQVTRSMDLNTTQEMLDIIQDSDMAPQLLYAVSKDQDLNDRLSRMPERQLAREIGRLEAKLSDVKRSSVSKAPAPAPKIEAVEPSVSVSASDPRSDKLSTADWLKRRQKQLKNR